MVLVEADPSGERKVRAHAHEHPPPPLVADIEVVLHNPAVCDLKMPAVCLLVTDRGDDPRGFSRLQDDDDLIWPCCLEVGVDELVTTALGSFDDWSVPLGRSLLHPDLKLFCSTAQDIAAHRIEVPVNVEKADHSLGLLKRLDEPVQQDAVETPIIEADAVLVMIVEGVHDRLLLLRNSRIACRRITVREPESYEISRAKPLASWPKWPSYTGVTSREAPGCASPSTSWR